MKKPTRAPQKDLLSVARCRRLLRPLVSKIHALTASSIAFSSLLDVHVPLEAPLGAFSRPNLTPGDLKDPLLSKKRRKPAPDHDYNHRLVVPDDNVGSNAGANLLDSFVRPKTAQGRLDSLKPYISPELHHAYTEVYGVFRSVVLSLVAYVPSLPTVPKLTSLCALKVGKSIALSQKSTYYKLSQAILFNEKTLAPPLREFLDLLDDDIDGWLDLEPHAVSHSYRYEFLLGYIIHLVVFNLGLTLFLLVPVLIHWLKEELSNTQNGALKALLQTLFAEFWHFSPSYFAKTDTDVASILHSGAPLHEEGNRLFWKLYECDYWRHMVRKLCLRASGNCDHYDGLMLEAIAVPNRLQPLFETNLMEFSLHPMLLSHVYPLVKRGVQHPKTNDILVHLATHLSISIQKRVRHFKANLETYPCLEQCKDDITAFIRLWLSFSSGDKDTTVFNTLYPGNEEIFLALSKNVNYLLKRCTKAFDQFEAHNENVALDMPQKLTAFYQKAEILLVSLQVLRAYYLEEPDFPFVGDHELQHIGNTLCDIQEHPTAVSSSSSSEFTEFLFWLFDHQKVAAKELARVCFRAYYGTGSWFRDSMLEDVHSVLFEEEVGEVDDVSSEGTEIM